MKVWLCVYALLVCVACDGGESDPTDPLIIACEDCALPDMAGAGGEGGDPVGGEGGDPMGGAGGDPMGGAGGDPMGGAGGDPMGGAGGGACAPACEGKVCGPDGCGGTCGPGCGAGEICNAGACVPGECPAGTFDCDGVCVDLLSDTNHCGSCGNSCADAWAAVSPVDGLSFEDAGIDPRCIDAECVYACEDGTPPDALLSAVDHCGACGATCDSGAVINSVGDVCVDAQCGCQLPGDDGPVDGVICDGRCERNDWENCAGGCCPRLAPGDNRVAADTLTAFAFDMPSTDTARIFTRFPRGGAMSQLHRYEDDGSMPRVEAWRAYSEARTIPVLPRGRYLLRVYSSSEPGVVHFERSRAAVDFVAPGAQRRDASAEAVHVTFHVPEDGAYDVLFAPGPGGHSCGGSGTIALYDGDAELVAELADLGECRNRFSARWSGHLAAGRYTVRGISEDLWGDWQVTVE